MTIRRSNQDIPEGWHPDPEPRFVHLLADAAVSAGVVVAGAAIWLTGKAWIDPLTSLLITFAIGWGSWGLLKNAVRMGLLAVPPLVSSRMVSAWVVGWASQAVMVLLRA